MQTNKNLKANLLLIRHADSEYNKAQKVALNSITEVPDRIQNQTVKWSYDYLDCGISDIGQKQVNPNNFSTQIIYIIQCEMKEPEIISNYDIDYVFCSPMRRCLITTYNLFKNHPANPKIIVLPFLREELQSSCDIGSKVLESKKLFPMFDFSFLEDLNVSPYIWTVKTIQNKDKQEMILEKIKEKCKTEEDYEKFSAQIMIDFMKNAFPETLENRQEMAERAKEVRTILLPKILSTISLVKPVAIVSHSQFLYNFSAESFDSNYLPQGTKWFDNCEVRSLKLEF